MAQCIVRRSNCMIFVVKGASNSMYTGQDPLLRRASLESSRTLLFRSHTGRHSPSTVLFRSDPLVDSILCHEKSTNSAENRYSYLPDRHRTMRNLERFQGGVQKYSFFNSSFCLHIHLRREEDLTAPSEFLEAEFKGNDCSALFLRAHFKEIKA